MGKKMKVLISGSGGFIMSNFIRQAFHHKKPYEISSLDRIRDSMALQNIYLNKDHDFYIADIRDAHVLDMIFTKSEPDIVIHAAAHSHVDDSIKNASEFVTSNVLGTQNIIDACLRHKVEKMIMISTDEVTGHLNIGDKSLTEDAPLNPRNPYSASKASGELLIKAAHETHGLIYQIVRSCNNYGPYQTPDKFIPKIIKCVLNNTKIPVYGQGNQLREWIHVWDFCSALFKIIDDGELNTVYNISANQEFSNIEVVQEICNIIGSGYDLVEHVEDRLGHDFRYSVDATKLKNLGWKYNYKFKDGLKQTVEWYSMNKYALGLVG